MAEFEFGPFTFRRGEDTRTPWQRAQGGLFLSDVRKKFEAEYPEVPWDAVRDQVVDKVMGQIEQHNAEIEDPDVREWIAQNRDTGFWGRAAQALTRSPESLFPRKPESPLLDVFGPQKIELFDDEKNFQGRRMREALERGPRDPSLGDRLTSYLSDAIEGATLGHVSITGAEIDKPTRLDEIVGGAARFGGAAGSIKRIGGGVQSMTGLSRTAAAPLALGAYEAGQADVESVTDAFQRFSHGVGLGVGLGTLQPLAKAGAARAGSRYAPEAAKRMVAEMSPEARALVGQETMEFATGTALSALENGNVDLLRDTAAGLVFSLGSLPGNVLGAARAQRQRVEREKPAINDVAMLLFDQAASRPPKPGNMAADQIGGELSVVSRVLDAASKPLDYPLKGIGAIDALVSKPVRWLWDSSVGKAVAPVKRAVLPIAKIRDQAVERMYQENLVGQIEVANNAQMNVRDRVHDATRLAVEEIRKAVPSVKKPGKNATAEEAELMLLYATAYRGREGAELIRELVAKHPDARTDVRAYAAQVANMVENIGQYPELAKAAELRVRHADAMKSEAQHQGLLGERFVLDHVGERSFGGRGGRFETEAGADKALRRILDTENMGANAYQPWRNWRVEKRDYPTKDPMIGGSYYVITGEVGAMRPGVVYTPEWHYKPGEGGEQHKYPQSSSSKLREVQDFQRERTMHDGPLGRVLRGDIPSVSTVAEEIAAMHGTQARAKIVRDYINELRHASITDAQTGEQMPVAILRTGIDRAIAEGAIKPEHRGFYEEINAPGFTALDKSTGTPQRVGIAVHRQLAPTLRGFVGDTAVDKFMSPTIMRGLSKFNYAMKAAKLTLSPFHYWALAMNTLAYGGDPGKAWRNWESQVRSDKVKFIQRYGGLTMGSGTTDVAFANRAYDGVFGQQSPFRRGPMNKLAQAERWFSRKLWHEFHRATKGMTAEIAFDAYIKKGFTPKEAARMAGRSVNQLHGGVNWNWEGLSNRVPQLASMAMLAPDWFISNWSWSMNSMFGAQTRSIYDRQAFLRVMIMNFVGMNMINKAASGHWMWENEEGHRMSMEFPMPDGSTYWADMPGTKHFYEPIRAFMGVLNETTDLELAEGYAGITDYFLGKRSALQAALLPVLTQEATWPPGSRIPTPENLAEGETVNWDRERNSFLNNPVGWAWYMSNMFKPIAVEQAERSVIEAGLVDVMRGYQDPEYFAGEVLSDPRLWTGVLGTKIKSDR